MTIRIFYARLQNENVSQETTLYNVESRDNSMNVYIRRGMKIQLDMGQKHRLGNKEMDRKLEVTKI